MATFGQFKSFGPFLSSSGDLYLLRIYHYIVGTTSLLNMWTTRNKASTVAQPLESDSAGIASAFGDGIYKFRIDGSTDGVSYSTIYTLDEVSIGDQSASITGEGAAISSASTLALGTDGDVFHVTGNTGPITAISGSQTRVTLVFDSTPTLTHSGNLILQYAADYVAAANVVMQFFNEGGGVWREVARTPAFVDIAAAGDLAVGTANDTTGKLTVGAGGTVLMGRAAATVKLAYVAALNKYIYGLTYANNAGDATNDLDMAAGGCMDATGAYFIVLSALTKQSDAVWAVGNAAGGLDAGAVGNNDYYIWAIVRSDTGVTDLLFSLSSTGPTMPASYDFKRLIGWFKRTGGTIVAFKTYELHGGGLKLMWLVPIRDVNVANTLTTSRRTDTLSVPVNFSVDAHIRVMSDDAAIHTEIVCSPDETDAAPSTTDTPGMVIREAAGNIGIVDLDVRTSATGTVASRSLVTVDNFVIITRGFSWSRRP